MGAGSASLDPARGRRHAVAEGRESGIPAALPQPAAHRGDGPYRATLTRRPGPVQRRLRFMRVGQFQLRIPAGEARHEIEAGLVVGRPMRIIAIHPHMHLLGREMKVWAKASDDSVTPLIYINDWDFNWQGFYFYRMPVALPVGSWIELTAAWDNSATNPRNPNKPPRNVYWRERTVDEMGDAEILYTLADETAVQPR